MSNKPDGIDADIWAVAEAIEMDADWHWDGQTGHQTAFKNEHDTRVALAQALQAERNKAKALERILDEIHKADFAAKENDFLYRTLVVRALKNRVALQEGNNNGSANPPTEGQENG